MPKKLVDPHGRVIDYLRVSITDLCNLRCSYCRPPEGVPLVGHEDILRYEEILTIVELAASLGVRKVRVTGGEPLVRRGVVDFMTRLTRLEGLEDVALTTNGVRLAEMAADLKNAGLTRVNVSLDSLRPDVYAEITGKDAMGKVLDGIDKALEVGLAPVKINVVLMAEVNEADVPEFARMTRNKPLDVRFIERMPFGPGTRPEAPLPFSATSALRMITENVGKLESLPTGPLDGPATMFRLEGAMGNIGIIDPVTGHFCGTCNRLRLTARGTFRPCLLGNNEIDIKTAMRRGASREEVSEIIRHAVASKPAHGGLCDVASGETMNTIGG